MFFSLVKHEKKMLEMIGRKLKRHSVALNTVNFGEEMQHKNLMPYDSAQATLITSDSKSLQLDLAEALLN